MAEVSGESKLDSVDDGQQVTIPMKMIPETPPEQVPPDGELVGCDGAMNGAVTAESNPTRLDDVPVFLEDKHEVRWSGTSSSKAWIITKLDSTHQSRLLLSI